MDTDDHGDTPEGGGDGTGRDTEADRFASLFECLHGIGEPGAKAWGFLDTGRLLLRLDAPVLPRRGEAVAYCVRQAADSILETAGSSPEDRRWEQQSRKVVSAKERYEREKRFPEGRFEEALAELLAEIDALERVHNEVPKKSERQAAEVHARITGSRAAGDGLRPVRDFLRVRDEAGRKLHSTCTLDDAEQLLAECVDAMLGFLRSTADKSAELAELAGRVSPGSTDLEAAQKLIINTSDVEEFLRSAADPKWLVLLYRDGRLGPPGGPDGWWAASAAAIRLSGSHRQQVADWLKEVADQDRGDSARAAAVVGVLLRMDGPDFEAALKIAARHPRERGILHDFSRALEGVVPSDPVVERCADIFLNALIPEEQPNGLPADTGPHRISGDMTALLRMLSDGVDEENAKARIELPLFKLMKMPSGSGARSLLPLSSDQRMSISSLADLDDRYGDRRRAIGGCLVGVMARAMGLLPAAELLELAEKAPEELAGRLRTWILATAPDADPEDMAAEIERAIGSRSPHCDDVALLDRLAAELGPDPLTDRFRAALGDPPSVAEASEALGSGEVLPEWRFPYLWSGLLPEPAAEAWAESSATHVLAAQIGSPETRDDFLGLQDDPDIMGGWVESPLSAEQLREFGPVQAADEIAAWRPQPHDWGHNYQQLARTLEQVVGEDPAVWLAEPVQVAVRLRHPTYISAYLQGAAKAATDNPDDFATVPVGGLVDVITMVQREPWTAEQFGGGSRPGLDYTADWLSTRRAGTDLVKALLDSEIGLADRDSEVWTYLEEEARTNPEVFEVGPVGIGFEEDPVGYMLDNAEEDHTPSDPLFLAINEAGTRAVDAALSFMAAEYRATGAVRHEATRILEWCLNLEGLEGAKHRAIIAPNAARLSHILPEWFDQNHSLLFGEDAPGQLGQVTVNIAVKFSLPWEWLLVNHRDNIYDSAARGVERSHDWLLIAMLHGYDGYAPPEIVQRLNGRYTEACWALASLIDRIEEPTPKQLEALREFCEAVIEHDGGQDAAALGRMAHADCFDHDTWTDITLKALEATGGYIEQAHQITQRILDNPPTPQRAAILVHLVEVQTNEALARTTTDIGEDQPVYFDGAWTRRLIADKAADWLASAQDHDTAEEYGQLAETLRRHGLLRSSGPDST